MKRIKKNGKIEIVSNNRAKFLVETMGYKYCDKKDKENKK